MSKTSEEMKELKKLVDRFHTFTPARGHVSYLCASRVVPEAWVAGGGLPGFRVQRMTLDRPTWIISGRDKTSAEGQVKIDICEYLQVPECSPVGYQDHWGPAIIDGRPAFFTSPHSEEPVVMSTKIESVAQEEFRAFLDMFEWRFYSDEREYKVMATVRAWKLDGGPATVDFSWLCIAEAAMRWKAV